MTNGGSEEPSVLLLVASSRRRGAEVFGETLAQGLSNAGWRVSFASLAGADGGPVVSATPLSDETPDSLSRLDRSVVAAVRKEVRSARPDIVLANGSSTMQYVVAAVRHWRDRPRLVYVSIGEPMWWVRNVRHRLLRTAILKGVDRVFSVSAATAQQLIDHLGVPKSKVRIAPTGVPERFFALGADAEDGRPAGEADGPVPLRVLFIGNLSTEKGPMEALAVLSEAAVRRPIAARFLGDGPVRGELERAVAAGPLAACVEVLGSVADVAPHIAWADVLLQTSQTEGLPGVPLEAGAGGVACVVFDVGGSRETVIDGETGFVVAPGDVASAAETLVALADDPPLVAKMGAAARAYVRSNFTLDAAVRRYIELLTDELPAR